MKVDFWKYQGTGNDFILIDNTSKQLIHSPELAVKLCDRHFGIGSDGLIIIENSDTTDFKMFFYNPDGSESFCGNGSRCAVRFAFNQGVISNAQTTFISTDGEHAADISENIVNLQMKAPHFLTLEYHETELPETKAMLLNTGSPHLVLFIYNSDVLADLDVHHHGARIRYSEAFAEKGVNVNFVSINTDQSINIRTYERGVEAETLSCGTGVTASAIAYHRLFKPGEGKNSVRVHSLGGDLNVEFEFNANTYNHIYLCGAATPVFKGVIDL